MSETSRISDNDPAIDFYLRNPARLSTLAKTGLPDSPPEPSYDRLTRLVAKFLGTPVALISLVDDGRQFFKSCIGLPEPWASQRETPLTHSFCQHVIVSREPLVINDARADPRVKDNRAIPDLGVIAYLGIPLVIDQHVIGSLCAIDGRPRDWTADDISTLRDIAESVVTEIRFRTDNATIERQRNEKEDARLRLEITLSSIGDAVITTDAGGAITFLNPVAEALCGLSAEKASGQPLEAVCRVANEHTRQVVENPVSKAIASGGLANHTILLAHDGREYPIEGSAAPIEDMLGKIVGIVLVFRDATARRIQETELKNARVRLDSMLSVGNIGTWEYDIVNGVVTADSNLARIYGVESHGPMTGPIDLYFKIIHPDDHARIMQAVGQAIDSTNDYESEYRLVMPDRSIRWVIARGRVQRNASGKAVKLPGVVVDITERKEAAEDREHLVKQLRDADIRKDEFLAMLAHELRNPLGVISNGVQLVQTVKKPELLAELRETIQHQVQHLTHLIDDLLDVSRITQGKIELKKQTVELAAIVGRAVELVKPLAGERQHELTVSVPDDPVWFVADPTRTEQVLGNLLTNAAKYSPTHGTIHLSAEVDGNEVVFRVRDAGDGISAEMLPKIFDLFTQVDATIDRTRGGLGIGLTLVKNLVEMHDGQVSATSEGKDKGCEFTVRLPIGLPTRMPAENTVEKPQDRDGTGRVLIVDDNVETVRLTARLLSHYGYHVESAHDGIGAMEKARMLWPDVILLDIGLPGMNGYQVANQLRREDCCRTALLIAISGYGEEASRERSKAAGFDHHLTKPVDFDVLRGLLVKFPAKS